nr:hypothetical protein [Tanacetum cinerariifolium]
MSDSDESGVTYTEAPPSPDYISGLEEPEQAPPLPDYVPGPEHADDEIVAEDQPYDEDASPTAQSPEYVPVSDLEAHPEEDDEEDPKEDPEEEEEEHPAPADSVVVALPAIAQAPSAEEAEPFETDESAATLPPHPAYRVTARISIPAPLPVPVWSDSEVARLLAMSSPPSSPLSPLEDRPEVTLPPRKRLGIALGPVYEVGESSSAVSARPAGGLRTDYGIVTTMDREIMRDSKRKVGYEITDSWDEIMETLQGAPVSTDTELGGYMREFETRVRRDTDEIYSRLDDEQSQMTEIRELHAADLKRQIVTLEMLRADHRRSVGIRGLRIAERTGDSLTGTGCRTTRIAGTRWRSYTARAARGGW